MSQGFHLLHQDSTITPICTATAGEHFEVLAALPDSLSEPNCLSLTQSCSTEAVGRMCSVSQGGRRWRGPERRPHDWCWGSNWKSRCVGGHSDWSEEPRSGVGVQSRVQVHPWASSGLWASESRSMQLGSVETQKRGCHAWSHCLRGVSTRGDCRLPGQCGAPTWVLGWRAGVRCRVGWGVWKLALPAD